MPAPVAVETVLVPVDGSEESLEAVEYAVAIADRYDAGVHALYVLDETVVRALDAGDLTDEEVAADHEDFMAMVRDAAGDVPLTHSTVMGFTPTRLSRHPGSAILDAAEDVETDFIVVPREPVSGDPHEVLGKAAEYVLAYATQPVLSV